MQRRALIREIEMDQNHYRFQSILSLFLKDQETAGKVWVPVHAEINANVFTAVIRSKANASTCLE